MQLKAKVTGLKSGIFFNKDGKVRVVIEFTGADLGANYIVIPMPEIPVHLGQELIFELLTFQGQWEKTNA